MSDPPTENKLQGEAHGESGEKIVYVIPEDIAVQHSDGKLDLVELWNILWRGKWLIFSATLVFAVISVAYALLATEWYRGEALLAPAEAKSAPALGGQLSGLAALAGVSVGGQESAEALAVLQSRQFLGSFIETHNLMPILLHEQWDTELNQWATNANEDAPDIRDAIKYFREDLLRVEESQDTGLVAVSVDWIDPALAAEWVTILVQRLNDRLRERALQAAEANVGYLQGELARTSLVTLQQSIGSLLESELQKLMLARGNEEFAFRIVDPPQVPKERVYPKRALIAVLGTLIGGMFGVFMVFVLHGRRSGFGLRA